MKNIYKILVGLLCFMTISSIVYATVANLRKSPILPWLGTTSGYYDAAHNVGTSYVAEARFSCVSGTCGSSSSIGVVYDNRTGLYWQSRANTFENSSCKSYDTNNFVDTGCNEGISFDDCNYCAAESYCANLELGGYSDWRLPNYKEFYSHLDFTTNPSVNLTYFYNDISNYWTSTNYINVTRAYYVSLGSGFSSNNLKYSSLFVRCVR